MRVLIQNTLILSAWLGGVISTSALAAESTPPHAAPAAAAVVVKASPRSECVRALSTDPNAAYVTLFRKAYRQGSLVLQDLDDTLLALERGEIPNPFIQVRLQSAATGLSRGFSLIKAHSKIQSAVVLQKLRELKDEIQATLPLVQKVQTETRRFFYPTFEKILILKEDFAASGREFATSSMLRDLPMKIVTDKDGFSWIAEEKYTPGFFQDIKLYSLSDMERSKTIPPLRDFTSPFLFRGQAAKLRIGPHRQLTDALLMDLPDGTVHLFGSDFNFKSLRFVENDENIALLWVNAKLRNSGNPNTRLSINNHLIIFELGGKRVLHDIEMDLNFRDFNFYESHFHTFLNEKNERILAFQTSKYDGRGLHFYNVTTGQGPWTQPTSADFANPSHLFTNSKGQTLSYNIDSIGHLFFQDLDGRPLSDPWYIGWLERIPTETPAPFRLNGRTYITLSTQWLDSKTHDIVVIDLENPEKMFRVPYHRAVKFLTAFTMKDGHHKIVYSAFDTLNAIPELIFVDLERPAEFTVVPAPDKFCSWVRYALSPDGEERVLIDVGEFNNNKAFASYQLYLRPPQNGTLSGP